MIQSYDTEHLSRKKNEFSYLIFFCSYENSGISVFFSSAHFKKSGCFEGRIRSSTKLTCEMNLVILDQMRKHSSINIRFFLRILYVFCEIQEWQQ